MPSTIIVSGRPLPFGIGPWPLNGTEFRDWRIREFRWPGEGEGVRGLPTHLRYAARKARTDTLSQYRGEKQEFEAALGLLPPRKRGRLRDTLEALRFIDHSHIADALMKSFLSGDVYVDKLRLYHLYNPRKHSSEPPFSNIKRAGQYLKNSSSPPGVTRLKKVHKLTMADGVEGVLPSELGRIRDYVVRGDETEIGITKAQLRNILLNPYLSFEEEVGDRLESDRVHGHIIYPSATTISTDGLERIKNTHPTVYSEVREFQSRHGFYAPLVETTQFRRLTRRLIEALLEERYEFFNKEAKKLGSLDSGAKVLAYIKLVAQHYRDIISIHPLGNGNGRTVRLEALYDLLDKVGISRPRLNDPNEDVLTSPSQWLKQVLAGILNTDRVYRDIAERIRVGLSIENCPELLFPDRVRDVGIHHRTASRGTVKENVRLVPIEGGQFAAFVEVAFRQEPALMARFEKAPLEVLSEIRERYKKFAKSTQYVFTNSKGKDEIVRAEFADPDCVYFFGRITSQDPERWAKKISLWYRPKLVWRGLCDQEREVSEAELLSVFKVFGPYTLCQKLLELWTPRRRYEHLAELSRAELKRYNDELFSGDLYSMLQDHASATGSYHNSFGLSTSVNWTTGRAFAMGALVVDDNMHDYWRRQDGIVSRVVVGAYRAHKDIELNRYKVIDPRFSSRSSRQAEVVAMGGIDPDAVMIVQVIDRSGKIERSYVRHPERPTEIWLIDGGYHPEESSLEMLPASAIGEKFHLRI